MVSNGHDCNLHVPFSGFIKMFYKQSFKVQGMLSFYFPRTANRLESQLCIYRGMYLQKKSPSDWGVEGGNGEAHTSPNVEK